MEIRKEPWRVIVLIYYYVIYYVFSITILKIKKELN